MAVLEATEAEIEGVAVVAEEVLQEVQIVVTSHLPIVVEAVEVTAEVIEVEAEATIKTIVTLDRLEVKDATTFNHPHLMIKITEVSVVVEVTEAEVLLATKGTLEVVEALEAVDPIIMMITTQALQTEIKHPILVKPTIETTDLEIMIKDMIKALQV